jgi:hypothetical protein
MSPEPSQGRGQTCPSGRCREGSVLLGVVGQQGRVAYLSPVIPVDAEFVRVARGGRAPESRFRFSEPCVEAGCAQWSGTACGLIDRLLAGAARAGPVEGPLPRCGIRSSCRWFAQRGRQACAVCPLVIHTVPHGEATQPEPREMTKEVVHAHQDH